MMKKILILLTGCIFFLFLSCGGNSNNGSPGSSGNHVVMYVAAVGGTGTLSSISYKNASGSTVNTSSGSNTWSTNFTANSGTNLSITINSCGATCPLTAYIYVDDMGTAKAQQLAQVPGPITVTYTIP